MRSKTSLKKINIELGEYEYVKMRVEKQKKSMNYKTCQIFQQLNKVQWIINYRRYSSSEYQTVIEMLQNTQNDTVTLDQNEDKNILKIIMRPVFSKLITLNLTDNLIDNIESLTFIDSPLLGSIDLQKNKLTHLKSLKKCKFSQLKFLFLNSNFIKTSQQFQALQRFVLKPIAQLHNFSTAFYNQMYENQITLVPDNCQIEDFQQVFKPKKGNQISFLVKGSQSLTKISFRAKSKLTNQQKRRPFIYY